MTKHTIHYPDEQQGIIGSTGVDTDLETLQSTTALDQLKKMLANNVASQPEETDPDVAIREQYARYEQIMRKASTCLELYELVFEELATIEEYTTLLEELTKDKNIGFDMQALMGYATGNFIIIDKESENITTKPIEQIENHLETMANALQNKIVSIYNTHAITRAPENTGSGEDIIIQVKNWKNKKNATYDRVVSYLTTIKTILDHTQTRIPEELKTMKYEAIKKARKHRDKLDTDRSENQKTKIFFDLLENDELFATEEFNTKQPALRFSDPITNKNGVTCEVSKWLAPDEESPVLMHNPNPSTEDETASIFESKAEDGYTYIVALSKSGNKAFYRCVLQRSDEDIEQPALILVKLGTDMGTSQQNEIQKAMPDIIQSDELSKRGITHELLKKQVTDEQDMDTGFGVELGVHIQHVLQSLLLDQTLTIEDISGFLDDPDAEGGIINMIWDEVHQYRETCNCSITLDSTTVAFVKEWIRNKLRALTTGSSSTIQIYKTHIDQIKQDTLDEETKKYFFMQELFSTLEQGTPKQTDDTYAPDAPSSPPLVTNPDPDLFEAIDLLATTIIANQIPNRNHSILAPHQQQLEPIVRTIDITKYEQAHEQAKQQQIAYIVHQSKIALGHAVLEGLFEANAHTPHEPGRGVTGTASSSGSPSIEIPGHYASSSLATIYPDLGIYVDIAGIGNRNLSDEQTATTISWTQELALMIAITAVSGSVGAWVARRGLMTTSKAIATIATKGSKTATLAEKYYAYFKYMSLGAQTSARGRSVAWIGGLAELGINSATFHLTHGIISGYAHGHTIGESLDETLKIAGFLKSFVTLGILKKVGKLTSYMKNETIGNEKNIANALFTTGVAMPAEALSLMATERGFTCIVDKSLEKTYDTDPQTFLEQFAESMAFIAGLRIAHRPTHGLSLTKQQALYRELLTEKQITILSFSPLKFTYGNDTITPETNYLPPYLAREEITNPLQAIQSFSIKNKDRSTDRKDLMKEPAAKDKRENNPEVQHIIDRVMSEKTTPEERYALAEYLVPNIEALLGPQRKTIINNAHEAKTNGETRNILEQALKATENYIEGTVHDAVKLLMRTGVCGTRRRIPKKRQILEELTTYVETQRAKSTLPDKWYIDNSKATLRVETNGDITITFSISPDRKTSKEQTYNNHKTTSENNLLKIFDLLTSSETELPKDLLGSPIKLSREDANFLFTLLKEDQSIQPQTRPTGKRKLEINDTVHLTLSPVPETSLEQATVTTLQAKQQKQRESTKNQVASSAGPRLAKIHEYTKKIDEALQIQDKFVTRNDIFIGKPPYKIYGTKRSIEDNMNWYEQSSLILEGKTLEGFQLPTRAPTIEAYKSFLQELIKKQGRVNEEAFKQDVIEVTTKFELIKQKIEGYKKTMNMTEVANRKRQILFMGLYTKAFQDYASRLKQMIATRNLKNEPLKRNELPSEIQLYQYFCTLCTDARINTSDIPRFFEFKKDIKEFVSSTGRSTKKDKIETFVTQYSGEVNFITPEKLWQQHTTLEQRINDLQGQFEKYQRTLSIE